MAFCRCFFRPPAEERQLLEALRERLSAQQTAVSAGEWEQRLRSRFGAVSVDAFRSCWGDVGFFGMKTKFVPFLKISSIYGYAECALASSQSFCTWPQPLLEPANWS